MKLQTSSHFPKDPQAPNIPHTESPLVKIDLEAAFDLI